MSQHAKSTQKKPVIGRPRVKPIRPYFQRLMDEAGVSTLKELAVLKGIKYNNLQRLADPEQSLPFLEEVLSTAQKCGDTVDGFVLGVLNGDSC